MSHKPIDINSKIIYIDMDNVIVDFKSGLNKISDEVKSQYADDGNGKPHYDDSPNIFSLMEPMEGAVDAIKAIAATNHYELVILSTAPWDNPSAWCDKLQWVKHYFDSDNEDGLFYKRLILSHHKELCIQKDSWLIDDRPNNGAKNFGERHIHFGTVKFPTWESIKKFFIEKN